MSEKPNINRVAVMLEMVQQPPFETRATVRHELLVIRCPELAERLRDGNKWDGASVRVIGVTPMPEDDA
jgi:hypothetical protein